MEALGFLPQLRIMKIEKFVSKLIGFYLFFLALARISRMSFWFFQWQQRSRRESYYVLIFADLFYLILTCDFIYNFFKHKNSNLIPYN